MRIVIISCTTLVRPASCQTRAKSPGRLKGLVYAAALASLFAEDGFVLPNGRPPVRGRANIEHYYAGKGGPHSLRAMAFAAEGAVGYIIGGYARQRREPDVGKFTLTLRKETGGRWLIVSDMDSGNRRRE